MTRRSRGVNQRTGDKDRYGRHIQRRTKYFAM